MITPNDTMILHRLIFTDNSTTGELFLDSQFQCYILEPSSRIQPGKILSIPLGKFEIVMYESPHFTLNPDSKIYKKKVPLILNIPGHSYVEIHPGNFENAVKQDSHDCLLPGKMRDVDYVGDSLNAWTELVAKIEAKLAIGRFYLGVMGGGDHNG